MNVALVNPPWSFDGSIYFGCREPHLPLEYGYARALLERAGHAAEIIDGQLENLSLAQIRARVEAMGAEMIVVTTAPSYLFWRCAPPELRVPRLVLDALRDLGATLCVVGPHASTTPRATLQKLEADVVVMGECEEILVTLADNGRGHFENVNSICYAEGREVRVRGGVHASRMEALPSLRWSGDLVRRHSHHHHRFEAPPEGPGAEIEFSRGCPYHCTFCAKETFRNAYRKRPLDPVLEELDALRAQGVTYVYFIDEIFMPERKLLEALVGRGLRFGVQMRVDLWSREMLDLLGEAGCVSIEAGVESITREGRAALDKKCRMETEQLEDLLAHAKRRVGFVQANLLESRNDDPAEIEAFRERLKRRGVWANKPVPLFPYPGTPDYIRRWGLPDDLAWERAHADYLARFTEFSDIQEERPVPLNELERRALRHGA